MKNISVFFTLSLLLIFALCCFLLLNIQIQNYTFLQNNTKKEYTTYTPAGYVSNKVHSFDQASKISILHLKNKPVLKLSDDKSDTYLYQENSHLMELCVVKGMQPNLKDGQKLMKCTQFEVSQEKNIITCKVNGVLFSVRMRSGELV